MPTETAVAPRRSLTGVPLAVLSIVSVQTGATAAKHLFDLVHPPQVVLMRQGFAALILLAVVRPRLRGRSAAEWRTVVAFGVVLATMNLTFYEAVERIPIGVAVTVELLGPLGLAVALSRRARDLLWCALAVGGVVLLSEGGDTLDAVGLLFVMAAAVCWGLYVLLGRAAGARFHGLEGLSLALAFGAVVASPFAAADAGNFVDAEVIGFGLVVAVLSAIVPFSLDVMALRSVPARVFGVLMSLSPAMAALTAWLILGEQLAVLQVLGIALVIAASAATVLTSRTPSDPSPG